MDLLDTIMYSVNQAYSLFATSYIDFGDIQISFLQIVFGIAFLGLAFYALSRLYR